MKPYSEQFIETEISKKVFSLLEAQDWFIFIGVPGTGKTRLAMEILKKQREKGLKCLGITLKRMMFKYRDILLSKEISELDFVDEYSSYDWLCIDEIDKTTRTDSEKSVLYEILKTRYENNKPTILIMNEPLDIIKKELFGVALTDRLLEISWIVEFSGQSFRKRKGVIK